MAHRLDYLVLRIIAIALALGLTGYNAWLSWSHFGEPTGPIAAVTGAGLFVFGEYAWRDRQRLRAMLLFGLGAFALVISGTVVVHRVSATEEARLQAARSTNLPRIEAAKALDDTKEALVAAVAAAAPVVAPAVRAWSSARRPPGSGWWRRAPSLLVLGHSPPTIPARSASLRCYRSRRHATNRSHRRSCPCGWS